MIIQPPVVKEDIIKMKKYLQTKRNRLEKEYKNICTKLEQYNDKAFELEQELEYVDYELKKVEQK